MWLMYTSCFYSGSLEFGYMAGRACVYDQSPVKTLSLSHSWASLVGKAWLMLWVFNAFFELYWERTLGSSCLVSSRFHCVHLFPSLILFCFFTAVTHRCEYNSVLSPMSSPSILSIPGWSWVLCPHFSFSSEPPSLGSLSPWDPLVAQS